MFGSRLIAVVLLTTPLAGQADLTRSAQRQNPATLQNGRYAYAGVSFDVPASWTYEGTSQRDAVGSTARWTDRQTGIDLYAWMHKVTAPAASIAGLVSESVARKTAQRARDGYRAWRVRPESVRQTTIGGRSALLAVADFTSSGDGRPRVECLAWIYAPESRMLLFAFMEPEQLSLFQPEFEKIARSAILP